jgi:CheY-like chemotaxis protein
VRSLARCIFLNGCVTQHETFFIESRSNPHPLPLPKGRGRLSQNSNPLNKLLDALFPRMLGSDQAYVPAQIKRRTELRSKLLETTNEGCPLFAGRKLLVADDSPYYRTVIGLTFTDEGMEVTTVGDGRQALESVEQSEPDVILASVSMSELSGYELCRLIKQSERFGHIPVMLLAGLHEHFDQAEARRAGADDVVAKPFKSIRELVGRVGSLLGDKAADSEGHGYSTLGLNTTEDSEPSDAAPETGASADEVAVADENNMADVKVFVEAPLMAEHEPVEAEPEPAGSTSAADVELQTADTQQLQRIVDDPEPPAPIDYAQEDTRELKPVAQGMKPATPEMELNALAYVAPEADAPIGTPAMNEQPTAPLPTRTVFNEALLDLDDFDRPTQVAVDEDLILDLDFEESDGVSATSEKAPETVPAEAPAFASLSPVAAVAVEPEVASAYPLTHEEQHAAELNEWAIVADAATEPVPAISIEEEKPTEPDVALSPAIIDAIARRAVEFLSEKVVREIAWEVVPELAELLIKQKLEEQK